MSGSVILFLILTVITLGSALVVVTDRNLFHAALAMMVSFAGVAGFYAMLNSGFMAAAQLLVYIGAISILVIFAIMMTRRLMSADEKPFNSQAAGAGVGALGLFGLLAFVLIRSTEAMPGFTPLLNPSYVPSQQIDPLLTQSVTRMGQLLVHADGYVLPFELASVLLLAALVGAIVVAIPTREEEE
ncbi:MAG: NADH-quinone oxidoreductase subunit J [Candidatus Promineifilaceae bacterium]